MGVASVTPTPPGGMLVLGRRVDGMWAVSEGTGRLIGSFSSYDAALLFAEDERRMRPEIVIATSAGAQETVGIGDAR